MTAIFLLWLGCVGSLVFGSLGAFFVSRFMSRVSRTTMFSIERMLSSMSLVH